MKVWVNEDKTVLVRASDDDYVVLVSLRGHPEDVWRAPIRMVREK